jgi:hypothetical protein
VTVLISKFYEVGMDSKALVRELVQLFVSKAESSFEFCDNVAKFVSFWGCYHE